MNEDDFYIVKEDMPDLYEGAIVINGDLGYEIDGSKARSQSKKLVKEIIKNQEDAKQWKIYLDGGMNNLFDIHERLKKEIEFIKKLTYNEDGHTKRVLALLQKILGEKND